MADDDLVWQIVHAALAGVIIVPLFVIWILTMAMAGRHSDPARTSFSWLKATYPFMLLSLCLIIIADVASIFLISWSNGYSSGYSRVSFQVLRQMSAFCSSIAVFFECITDALFVVLLVELGNGFRMTKARQRPSNLNLLRYGSMAAGLLLFALAVSAFGLRLAADVPYYTNSRSSIDALNNYTDSFSTTSKLFGAFYILGFIFSIGQVVYAGIVLKGQAGMPARKSAILYLVATILEFIRFILFVVLYGRWALPRTRRLPLAWNAVDGIGDIWVRFVVYVLLLVIGARKHAGVWTTMQSWMVPAMHTYQQPMYAQGFAPQQYGVQQQQQQQYSPYPPPPPQQPQQPQAYQEWKSPQIDGAQRHELAHHQDVVRPEELDASAYRQTVNSVSSPPPGHVPQHQSPVHSPVHSPVQSPAQQTGERTV